MNCFVTSVNIFSESVWVFSLWSAGVFREATTDFTVDARALTKVGGKHIKAHVKNPSGAATDCVVSDNGDGTYNVEYTPFENGTMHNFLLKRPEKFIFLYFRIKYPI